MAKKSKETDQKNGNLSFAEVIVGKGGPKILTYHVPPDIKAAAKPGCRVIAPFRRGVVVGLIARRVTHSDIVTKPIIEVVDDKEIISPALLSLLLWTTDHYFASPGDVMAMILPKDEIVVEAVLSLIAGAPPPVTRSVAAKALYDHLEKKGGKRRLDQLVKELSMSKQKLARLVKTEAVLSFASEKQTARKVKIQSREDSETKPAKKPKQVSLTDAQKKVYDQVSVDVENKNFAVHLLHGVTGSGKTEVYAHLAALIIGEGGGVLILSPEIALADALSSRLSERVGVLPITIHSDMTPRERYRNTEAAASGASPLVVGARSAVFTPIKNLRLIIVDEEHDQTYKQETQPRYNGRDVAIKRASIEKIPVLLGSATPSMESFAHAMEGKYKMIELKERVDKKPMPKITMVFPETPGAPGAMMIAEIEKRLEANEQSLIFINRRGAARYVQCTRCGEVIKCANCSVSLVWHEAKKTLACHTCGFKRAAPVACAECGDGHFFKGGGGSERVETEIHEKFPEARIARMDRDTTTKRRASEKILRAVENREVDILIGTQMVTKGHDYHGITFVGAISADDSLHIPDFRAAERTFQLITQAAGRAGRGKKAGLVVVQTLDDTHHSLIAATNHDYKAFYDTEAALRKAAGYPPFVRIAMIRIDASSQPTGESFINQAEEALANVESQTKGLTIMGPAEAMIFKARNRFHWRVMLKAKTHHTLGVGIIRFFEKTSAFKPELVRGVNMTVDMDPASCL